MTSNLLIFSASSSRIETSVPVNEAGSNPKVVKALNLPPTFELALNTLYPDLRPLISKAVP